ncbi:MAG: ACT domain-containing protein [Thermofilum sp.]|nr:ACT domain-containing protein [Thermofilum sp.]MCC6064916.1 ACT domain-containing protein [Thermofilum sp.]
MSSQLYEFAVMDSKGRIFIPARIRAVLNVREGMRFMVIADLERHEIRLVPLADAQSEVVKLTVLMKDVVGALSKVVDALAAAGVDLLITQSRTIRRGELAEWVAIADFSKSELSIEKVVERLSSLDVVKKVEWERLEFAAYRARSS